MKESGFGDVVRDALIRNLKPLLDELARVCQSSESESLSEPERAAEIISKLFVEKRNTCRHLTICWELATRSGMLPTISLTSGQNQSCRLREQD